MDSREVSNKFELGILKVHFSFSHHRAVLESRWNETFLANLDLEENLGEAGLFLLPLLPLTMSMSLQSPKFVVPHCVMCERHFSDSGSDAFIDLVSESSDGSSQPVMPYRDFSDSSSVAVIDFESEFSDGRSQPANKIHHNNEEKATSSQRLGISMNRSFSTRRSRNRSRSSRRRSRFQCY